MGNSYQGTKGTIAVADTSHVAHEHVTSIQLPPAAVVADSPVVVKYVIVRSSLVFYCLFSMGGYFRVNNDFFEKCVNLALPSAALVMCQSIKSVYVKV